MPSSVISHYHYDEVSKTLTIAFLSGAIYDYKQVPKRVYDAMRRALSKGVFLNRNVKGKYVFEKIK